jgi:hypothetical protein
MKQGLFTALCLLILSTAFGQANKADSTSSIKQIRLLAKVNNLWGYVDQNGKERIPFMYNRANPFDQNEVARVEHEGKFKIINKNNVVLINGAYQNFQHLSGAYYKYQQDSFWGITILTERFKSRCEYKEPYPFVPAENLFKVQKGEYYGVLDSGLNVIVGFEYDHLWSDSNFIIVSKEGKLGAYNFGGQMMLQTEWDSIIPLSLDYLVGIKGEKAYLVRGGKKDHKELSSGEYMALNSVYFAQKNKEKTKIIRLSDGQEKSLVCDMVRGLKDADHSFVFNNNSWFGLYNFSKGVVLKPEDQYEEIKSRDSLLFVRKAGKYKLYSREGAIKGGVEFVQCLEFDSGFAFVRDNLGWGILKKTGELLIPIEYKSITVLQGEIRAITKGGALHLYETKKGKITDKMVFGSVYKLNLKGFENKIRQVVVPSINLTTRWVFKNRWGLVDSSGNELIKPLFQSIENSETPPYVFVKLRTNKGDRYPFGLAQKAPSSRIGLVNEQTGKIIAFPHFSMVDKRDVNRPNQDLVRVRSYSGYYAVVSKSAKRPKVFWKTSYIGPFEDGLAPIYLKGYMTLKKPTNDAESIGYLWQIIEDMGFSSGWGLFDRSKYSAFTKVYMKGGSWNYLTPEGRLLYPSSFMYQSVAQRLDYAAPFEKGLAKVKSNGKWGLINKDGDFVTELEYDWLKTVHKGDSMFYVSHVSAPQHSCFSGDGEVVNDLPVNYIEDFSEGIAWVKRGAKFGFMNLQGKVELTDLKIKRHGDFGNGYAPVKIGRKWTYVDEQFNQLESNKRFYNLGPFSESKAYAKGYSQEIIRRTSKARKRPLYGYVDEELNWVVAPKFLRAYDFKNGRAKVKAIKGRYGYIDHYGVKIGKYQYTRGEDFTEDGLAQVWKGSKAGVIGVDGKDIVKLKTQKIEIQEGAIFVQRSKRLIVYNKQGKRIRRHRNISRVYQMEEGLARVRQNGYVGFMNNEGDWVLPPRYGSATNFENGYALVGRAANKLIINLSGDTVNPQVVKTRTGFQDGYLLQKTEGKRPFYYFINTAGQNQFGVKYEFASNFQYKKAVVRKDGHYGVIDQNGLFIVPPVYSSISKVMGDMVVATNNYNYGLLSVRGEEALAPVYESIRILPEGIIMITKEGNPSYMNLNLEWLWRPSQLSVQK